MSKTEINIKELVSEDVENLINKAVEFCDSVNTITINTQEEYDKATKFVKDVKRSIKTLDDKRKEIGDPFRLKAKAVNDKFSPTITALKNGEKVLKNGMGIFFQEQEKIRLAKERQLQLEKEAEERKLEEQSIKEQEKADKYREEGRDDLADQAEVRAENKAFESQNIVAETVEDTTAKKGVSFVETYEISIVNEDKAIQSLLNNGMSHFLKIDEGALKKAFALSKGKMKVDGVNCKVSKKPRIRA